VGSLAATSLLGAKRRAGIELVADGVALALTEEELVLEGGEVVRSDPWAARRRVDEDFVAAVRGEPDRVLAPYAEALETHRLGCALAASAAAGEPVELGGG
jgi:predicted dehydrogenase